MNQGNESPGGDAFPRLDPSAISVIHCDPFTGIVIDPIALVPDRWPSAARQPYPTFATEEEARGYCREIVHRYPHLECHVTGPGLVPWRHRDEEWIERESEARRVADARRRRRDVLMASAVGVVVLVVVGVCLLGVSWLLLRLWAG
jgi:hypothetical protein